jgi:hypothetical protein
MSIQILLEPASINNKSLDLYCNKIEVNDFDVNTIFADNIVATNTTTGTLVVGNIEYLNNIQAQPRKKTILGIPRDFEGVFPYLHPYYYSNITQSPVVAVGIVPTNLLFNSTTLGVVGSTSILDIGNQAFYEFEMWLRCDDATGYNNLVIFTLFLDGTALSDVSIPSIFALSPVKFKARIAFNNGGTTSGEVIQNYEVMYNRAVTAEPSFVIQNNRATGFDLAYEKQLSFSARLTTASIVPFRRETATINMVYSGVNS